MGFLVVGCMYVLSPLVDMRNDPVAGKGYVGSSSLAALWQTAATHILIRGHPLVALYGRCCV